MRHPGLRAARGAARRGARIGAIALAVAGAIAATGCGPKPIEPPPIPAPGPSSSEPFGSVWNRAMEAQARRRNALRTLMATGQVELRWHDDDGSHFEFCRGELFLRLPDDTALSLTKVGERFLWLGSDESQRWLFDMRNRDATLWLVDAGSFAADGSFVPPAAPHRESATLPIAHVSVIDLLGLMEFPPLEDLDSVSEDASDAPRVEFTGQGGPVRVVIDGATSLPRAVEVLGDDGSVLVRSAFEAYEPVEREGLPPGGLPRWPSRVVVRTPATLGPASSMRGAGAAGSQEGGSAGATAAPATAPGAEPDATGDEVKLFLTPSPHSDDRVVDRLFDLESLKRTFKPVRVKTQ